jgi:hypothetical protein
MARTLWWAAVGAAVLFAGCAGSGQVKDSLNFETPPQWQLVRQTEEGGVLTQEYLRETSEKLIYSQRFTLQRYPRSAVPSTPKEWMEASHRESEKNCKKMEWKVFSSDATSIFYYWKAFDCPTIRQKQELTRLLLGRQSAWRLAYTTNEPEPDPLSWSEWSVYLTRARVE